MAMVKVCIDYEFGIDLDTNSPEEFDREFNKLRAIIKEDTEKFVLSNVDNSTMKKRILFELAESALRGSHLFDFPFLLWYNIIIK